MASYVFRFSGTPQMGAFTQPFTRAASASTLRAALGKAVETLDSKGVTQQLRKGYIHIRIKRLRT